MRDEKEKERLNADFVLTISMNNTTVSHGQDFNVNVELRNNTENDFKIVISWLAVLYPIGWDADPRNPDPEADPPFYQVMFYGNTALTSVSVRSGGFVRSQNLRLGQHFLVFKSSFRIIEKNGEFVGADRDTSVFSNVLRINIVR